MRSLKAMTIERFAGPILALALIGFWMTMRQHIRHQRIEHQRAASKQAMDEQRAEQVTLQTYLDQMGMQLLSPVEFSAY